MKYFILVISLFLIGCEGFKVSGRMCESLQPGKVSSECRAYDEKEAEEASQDKLDDSGRCLKCSKAEKIEINK